jgi:hypothetical protein
MKNCYQVSDVSSMGRAESPTNLVLLDTGNGETYYFKRPQGPESGHAMLSEVFHSRLGFILEGALKCSQTLGQLTAQNELAVFNGKNGVISKNFSRGGCTQNLSRMFLSDRCMYIDAYSDVFPDLQDLDLSDFGAKYLKILPKDFQYDFIRKWIAAFYFGNYDMSGFNNMSFESQYLVSYGTYGNKTVELDLDPLHDFARCVEFYRYDKEESGAREMPRGDSFSKSSLPMCRKMHKSNRDYLLKFYPEVTKDMFNALLSLREKNKSKFEEICDFSGASEYCQSFWGEVLSETQIKNKLSTLGENIRTRYDERIDLVVGNYK